MTIIILIVSSCQLTQEKIQSDTAQKINLDITIVKTDSINLSHIAEKIEYIPLQTIDNSIVENFNDYVVTKDHFFIQSVQKIFVFDKDGTFNGELFRVGRGPGESSAQCFAVNEDDELVYVLESQGQNLKIYNFEKKFVEAKGRINLHEHFTWSIAYFDNKLLVATAQRPSAKYLYSLFDLNSDSISIIYKNNREYTDTQLSFSRNPITAWDYHYQVLDSSILLKERFCDTIVYLNQNLDRSPKYIIDLGNNKCTWQDWRDNLMFNDPRSDQNTLPSGYYVQSFVDSHSFLFTVLRSATKPQIVSIFEKKNGNTTIVKAPESADNNRNSRIFLKNDLDFLVPFPVMNQKGYMTLYDNCLYGIIEAKEFVKFYQKASEKLKNSSDYLKNMASGLSNIDEFYNPIIVKVYLKK